MYCKRAGLLSSHPRVLISFHVIDEHALNHEPVPLNGISLALL